MAHKVDVGAAEQVIGAGRRRSSGPGARHWFIVAKNTRNPYRPHIARYCPDVSGFGTSRTNVGDLIHQVVDLKKLEY